jgi:hypothetical protein
MTMNHTERWEPFCDRYAIFTHHDTNRGRFQFLFDSDMALMLKNYHWTVMWKLGKPTLVTVFGGQRLYAHRMVAAEKISKNFKKVLLRDHCDLRAEMMVVQLEDGTYKELKK